MWPCWGNLSIGWHFSRFVDEVRQVKEDLQIGRILGQVTEGGVEWLSSSFFTDPTTALLFPHICLYTSILLLSPHAPHQFISFLLQPDAFFIFICVIPLSPWHSSSSSPPSPHFTLLHQLFSGVRSSCPSVGRNASTCLQKKILTCLQQKYWNVSNKCIDMCAANVLTCVQQKCWHICIRSFYILQKKC